MISRLLPPAFTPNSKPRTRSTGSWSESTGAIDGRSARMSLTKDKTKNSPLHGCAQPRGGGGGIICGFWVDWFAPFRGVD